MKKLHSKNKEVVTEFNSKEKEAILKAIDTLNDVVAIPTNIKIPIENTSWVDMLSESTSGIALGTADSRVYENMAYPTDPIVANYFSQYTRSVNSANRSITYMLIKNKTQLLLLDKFHTLVGQLENEFEWMKLSLREKIKKIAVDLVYDMTHKIAGTDLESIYYVSCMNLDEKDPDYVDRVFKNVEVVLNPIVISLIADIMAYLTTSLYDTFYEELVTEITSEDFNIICEYMKPYLIEFKDDLFILIMSILLNLMLNRVNTTYTIYNQAKSFAEEMDVPFYY